MFLHLPHSLKNLKARPACSSDGWRGRPALNNTDSCLKPTQCSPKAAVSPDGFCKCSKGVLFSGCSLLLLAASGPPVSLS